jgi:hypothetical protein
MNGVTMRLRTAGSVPATLRVRADQNPSRKPPSFAFRAGAARDPHYRAVPALRHSEVCTCRVFAIGSGFRLRIVGAAWHRFRVNK